MKVSKIKLTFLRQIVFSLLFMGGFSIRSAIAQEQTGIPDFMTTIETSSKKLQDKIAAAQKRFQGESTERRFWVGYRFEPRADVEFDYFYVHEDGGITISSGRADYYPEEDDDLKTHVLRALSELGDENARKAYEVMRKEFSEHRRTNWGLFFLLDRENLETSKIKLTRLYQERRFNQSPVYWLGEVDNTDSFQYLTTVIRNEKQSKKVIKPAVFVMSLHEHPGVIAYLANLAAKNDIFEIRKSAAFWLGQIPREESFDSLVKLFDDEESSEMKEKLVFSISQHKSERSTKQLIKIAKSDEDAKIREKAIFWLGQIDREESLTVLDEMLQGNQPRRLKEKIVFAISQHKSERAVPILVGVAEKDPDREVRKKAIFWLGQMAGKKTLDALGDVVASDEDTDVKTKAVFAISQHQDKERAIEMLIDIARNNPNAQVRKKAMFWLGQTGDDRAVAFFKEVLTK